MAAYLRASVAVRGRITDLVRALCDVPYEDRKALLSHLDKLRARGIKRATSPINMMCYRVLTGMPKHSDIGFPSGRSGARQIVQEAAVPRTPHLDPPRPARTGYVKELVVKFARRRIPNGARLVGNRIQSSTDVLTLFRDLKYEPREHCFAVHVDGSNQVLSVSTPFIGTQSEAPAGYREIFRDAMFVAAAAIILVHNHPSGMAEPSAGDRELMREICRAGSLMRIPVLDFVIIGDDCHFSASDHGLIRSGEYQPASPAVPVPSGRRAATVRQDRSA